MFDIGWTELLLIGIVALIVVGPKDLPGMFRTLGRFMGKARAMAREFQRAMEQAADESGVKDMAREFKDASSGKDFGADELKSFAKGPKAWAREAARKSVVPDAEDGTDGRAKDGAKDGAKGGAKDGARPSAGPAGDATGPDAPARPRGPPTEALANARAKAAEARRAEAAARRPDPGADGTGPADSAAAPGPARPDVAAPAGSDARPEAQPGTGPETGPVAGPGTRTDRA